MIHSPLLITELDILILLTVACLRAIALKRLKSPYTVALVLLGIGLGWLGKHVESLEFLQTLTLSHDLILFVFVPPLIFESALNLDSRLLLRNLNPILTLAVGEHPPQLTQLIFKARVAALKLKLGETWMPQQAWVDGLRSQSQFNTCQFWGIMAYATASVPTWLQSLFEDSGLDAQLLQPCIAQYQKWHEVARQKSMQLETASLLALQTQITERIAQYNQQETIEDLMKTGAISEVAGNVLLQSVED